MITTTHAKPPVVRTLTPAMLSAAVLRCERCGDILGTAANDTQRDQMRGVHRCREFPLSRQPSIAVPFS